MSLVLTAFDKSMGVMVSDGRCMGLNENGVKVPTAEDCSKISRLDGSIIGITGGLREGYTSTSLRGLVTAPLRRDIHAASGTFGELCEVIPRILAVYRAKHPELSFGVSLLGNDNGVIRGATWTSVGDVDRCEMGKEGENIHVLGLTTEANAEALKLVRAHLAGLPWDVPLMSTDTRASLELIIRSVAANRAEINGNVFCETIAAVPMLADGTSLASASRVSIAPATQGSALTISGGGWCVTSLGWTVTSSGVGDVFEITASLALTTTAGVNLGNTQVGVALDSATWAWGPVTIVAPTVYSPLSINAWVTGLSAGTHTLVLWMAAAGTGTQQLASTASGTYAVCTRLH
jgi:hypothetical protein